MKYPDEWKGSLVTHVKDPYPNPEQVCVGEKKFEVKSGF